MYVIDNDKIGISELEKIECFENKTMAYFSPFKDEVRPVVSNTPQELPLIELMILINDGGQMDDTAKKAASLLWNILP